MRSPHFSLTMIDSWKAAFVISEWLWCFSPQDQYVILPGWAQGLHANVYMKRDAIQFPAQQYGFSQLGFCCHHVFFSYALVFLQQIAKLFMLPFKAHFLYWTSLCPKHIVHLDYSIINSFFLRVFWISCYLSSHPVWAQLQIMVNSFPSLPFIFLMGQ